MLDVMEFLKTVDKARWRKTRSHFYADCPHEFTVRRWDRETFEKLARDIRKYGMVRRWRSSRFRFLTIGAMTYWKHSDCLNRTFECALENDGHPSPASQKKIQKRFGRGVRNQGRINDKNGEGRKIPVDQET